MLVRHPTLSVVWFLAFRKYSEQSVAVLAWLPA